MYYLAYKHDESDWRFLRIKSKSSLSLGLSRGSIQSTFSVKFKRDYGEVCQAKIKSLHFCSTQGFVLKKAFIFDPLLTVLSQARAFFGFIKTYKLPPLPWKNTTSDSGQEWYLLAQLTKNSGFWSSGNLELWVIQWRAGVGRQRGAKVWGVGGCDLLLPPPPPPILDTGETTRKPSQHNNATEQPASKFWICYIFTKSTWNWKLLLYYFFYAEKMPLMPTLALCVKWNRIVIGYFFHTFQRKWP